MFKVKNRNTRSRCEICSKLTIKIPERLVSAQNRGKYRNRGNDITGLQTNRTYGHINGLQTQRMLITNFEHILMVEPLIYKILLSCHKQHQIFQASKMFSGSFNKHGYVNDSANNVWLGKRLNQIL